MGGILAIIIMTWNGVLLTTLLNAFRILFGMQRRSEGLKKPPMVPYGLAIASGTLFAIFLQEL